jgi:dTDP-4-dehydrorhamnose 3,5-epimerase
MGELSLNDIIVTSLSQIPTGSGDVMHCMKATDPGFAGFGEAYFSWVDCGAIKAWKKHTRMTMNVVIPVGSVRFVFALDGGDEFLEIVIGPNNYSRITVPPGIWFGFEGLVDSGSLVLNIASIGHDPAEVERLDVGAMNFDWG